MATGLWLPFRTLAALCVISFIRIQGISCEKICIIGAGIGGTSAAYFLRVHNNYSNGDDIHIFEASDIVGGRVASIKLAGDTFEEGGSVIHPQNLHMVHFVEKLGLERNPAGPERTFGIWTGKDFIFQTVPEDGSWWSSLTGPVVNLVSLVWRYGLSPLYMQQSVAELVGRFLRLYEERVPPFETPEEMLRHVGLFSLTKEDLENVMLSAGVTQRFIDEIITAGLRVNYGQDKKMSGLAGSVSIASFDLGLWSVKGGNRLVPEGLVKLADASLHLERRTTVISRLPTPAGGVVYEVEFSSGDKEECDVVVLATPLEGAGNLTIRPSINVAARAWQHTHATFIRGIINADYFGVERSGLPDYVFTVEDDSIPFSSISVLRNYDDNTSAYKLFSRRLLSEALLNQLFSTRIETKRVDWAAYPHYSAPERFAPYLLDGHHLYYINTFENAASTMEWSAVAAHNVAKLITSRLRGANKASGLKAPKLEQVVDRELSKAHT